MSINFRQLKKTVLTQAKTTARILKQCLRIDLTAVFLYAIGVVLEISSSLFSIYATAKIGGILASFITTRTADDIWLWLGLEAVSMLTTALAFMLMRYTKNRIYLKVTDWSINEFMTVYSKLDIQYLEDNEGRNKLNKVSSGYTWHMSTFSMEALDLCYAVIRFLAITAVASQIAWWLIPVITLFLIPSLVIDSRFSKIQWFIWDAKGDQRHVFWGLENAIRSVKGQLELRSTMALPFIRGKISSMNRQFYAEQHKVLDKNLSHNIPAKIFESAGPVIGTISLLRQFLAGAISIERYFYLSGALLRVSGGINTVINGISQMQERVLFAETFFELLDKQPVITDKPEAIVLKPESIPTIQFVNMSFNYPGKKKKVFENFNLSIGSGEHLAIVGENGAGKTTLIKLLLRFYKPTSGKILIDGHNLNDISIDSFYARLSTLLQEYNKYPLSIKENIALSDERNDTSEELLNESLKLSNVNQIIKDLPNGLDTPLDASFEKGVELSGGQWQRVALARAFYRRTGLLILDEPTSAIDATAEYEIFNNIFKSYKDRSALIVSHRFSTVRRADRIVVINDGKITENGSHDELMKLKGKYYSMFVKQAEGYQG